MKLNQWLPVALTVSAGAVLGVLATLPGQSQIYTGSNGALIAISSSVNNHIHSFGLQTDTVAALAAGLQNDNDTINLASSQALDGGSANGAVHDHMLSLSKTQLNQLAGGQSISVQSENSQGHAHVFQFIAPAQCAAAGQSVPNVMPSSSPSPSASPSASASPSPSTSPSVRPSSTPSVTPPPSSTPSPTGTATVPPRVAPLAPLSPALAPDARR